MRRLLLSLIAALTLFVTACSSTDSSESDEQGSAIEDRSDEGSDSVDGAPADPLGGEDDGQDEAENGDAENGDAEADEGADESAPPVHPALSELSGQLAIVDGGDVAIVSPDGSGGAIVDGQSVRRAVASQPVWSRDGSSLAWATVSTDEVSVSVLGGDQPDEISVAASTGNPVFYLQWAADGAKLAYLRNGISAGVEAGVATVGDGLEPLAEGQPFFVSWSPGSETLLAHIGGSFNGSQGQVVTFGPESVGGAEDEPEVVLRPTISFSAPAWLDESTVVGAADGGLLMVDLATGSSELLVETPGPIQFVVSPDGQRIAYRAAGVPSGPDDDLPPLFVLDVATGQSVVALQRNALAWEWSPSGDRLAILAPETASGFQQIGAPAALARQPNGEQFRWFFWEEQIFAATPPHVPSQLELSGYLPFFEQFAQSHDRWSGDGLGFAFAGTVGGQTGIWVQIAEDESTSSLVARGGHVTWSPISGAIGGGRSIQ